MLFYLWEDTGGCPLQTTAILWAHYVWGLSRGYITGSDTDSQVLPLVSGYKVEALSRTPAPGDHYRTVRHVVFTAVKHLFV